MANTAMAGTVSSACVKCGGSAGGVALCTGCTTGLRIELVDVPSLLANLDITRARLDQLVAPYDHGPGGGDAPLPYRPHVAEVVWVLHHTLHAWAHTLRRDAPQAASTAGLAVWLLQHVELIRRSDLAAQLADEVTHAIHYARHTIDRYDDHRQFLGPCGGGCAEELYGVPWHETAKCPACGTERNIQERQAWLHHVAQEHLATTTEIAGFLMMTGMRCTPSMIRSYANRKPPRLKAGGISNEGYPLYRIRDVVDALRDRYRRQAKAS